MKYDVAFSGKSMRGSWLRYGLKKKFRYPNVGVNIKWVSKWANIGPKWPNVKYDVAFCGKKCAEGSGDMVFVQKFQGPKYRCKQKMDK